MSLYREPGRTARTRRIAAAVALLLALGAGILVGRATAPAPKLADAVAQLRKDAAPVGDALELVGITYRGRAAVTRRAAADQLARARAGFAAIESRLVLLDPARARRARAAIARLDGLLRRQAAVAEVETAAADAGRAVAAAVP